jgi:predicted nucleotidyltransferase
VSALAASEGAEQRIVALVRSTLGDIPVLLCGSRATGTATAGSDFDLLVVLPWRRVPFALRRLAALANRLAQELGVPASINPLPDAVLRRRPNLFVWKLAREARVLAPPHGFELPRVAGPPLDDDVRFSYLMSALLCLLAAVEGGRLHESSYSKPLAHAVEKALLHVAQVRLMARGRYVCELRGALADLGEEQLEALACRSSSPEAWLGARTVVVEELARLRLRRGLRSSIRTNARYLALAMLRGRSRVRAAIAARPIDHRLARVAVALACTVGVDASPEPSSLGTAVDAVPRGLRGHVDGSWSSIHNLLLLEWPDAHPLLAQ